MYALYSRVCENNQVKLEYADSECLAGCNSGVVARELKKVLKPTDNSFMGWKIPIAKIYNADGEAFVIDLKPKSDEVLICELDTVYGYSYENWSPIMLRLRILSTDEEIDKQKIVYSENKSEFIYTVLYLNGSIKDGKLTGKWIIPFGTVTGLLFWSEAMTFFFEQVKLTDPSFLSHQVRMIENLRH